MKDFSEAEMPGWKTPLMGQLQDTLGFRSRNKILSSIQCLQKHLKPTDSLLDVGCFTGHLYKELGHENYTGVDLFPEHIEKAREQNPGVRFICSDFHDLEGAWDVVWCCRVLIHTPDFQRAAKKLLTLAKRLLIIVVSLDEKDKVEIETPEDGKVYHRWFSEETLRSVGDCEFVKGTTYVTAVYGGR